MNICLVTLEWPPYGCGIATYMFNLARGLNNLGHKVTVITNDKKPAAVKGVEIVEVKVPDFKSTLLLKLQKWRMEPYHTWSLMAHEKFLEISRSKKFDIMETAEYGAWGAHSMANGHVPVLVRCHNPTFTIWSNGQTARRAWKIPLWLRLQDKKERRQTFDADRIVTPSFALADHLALRWVIPRARFAVVPNPIDADLFRPNGSGKENANEILYVGRLQYHKGVFDLAEAVAPLMEKYKDIKIHFVGMNMKSPEIFRRYGDNAADVIRSIIPAEYHSRIIFTEHIAVSEIVSFHQKALCAVMPTRGFESFSYTAVEPMACGCPVIATHCGGPSEIITDGVDGFLVEPGDAEGIRTALSRLIEEPQLRERFASQARRTIEKRFSIPAVVPQIVRLYEETIKDYRKK